MPRDTNNVVASEIRAKLIVILTPQLPLNVIVETQLTADVRRILPVGLD
jgi:hypothetical protein